MLPGDSPGAPEGFQRSPRGTPAPEAIAKKILREVYRESNGNPIQGEPAKERTSDSIQTEAAEDPQRNSREGAQRHPNSRGYHKENALADSERAQRASNIERTPLRENPRQDTTHRSPSEPNGTPEGGQTRSRCSPEEPRGNPDEIHTQPRRKPTEIPDGIQRDAKESREGAQRQSHSKPTRKVRGDP